MILLDTCAIIWDALDPSKLSAKAISAIEQADGKNELLMSDISMWEIAMLIQRSRLQISTTAANFLSLYLKARNISVVPVSPDIAELSVSFSSELNSDPGDRIIAASSIVHHASLVTADMNLRQCGALDIIW
ncbi:MAG: type II toxin-antitoxin system VapC family toxin [Pseudohongiella sp.]|nr:type II toxin-antitoxin system VapC family toxin [Pseudohongiella sp.]